MQDASLIWKGVKSQIYVVIDKKRYANPVPVKYHLKPTR